MVNLEKTEKTININLADTLLIVRFLKGLLVWDIVDGYLSFSGEKAVPIPSTVLPPEEYAFVFYPRSILIPRTRYSYYIDRVGINLRVHIERKEVIKALDPIQLDVYRFNGVYGGKPKVEIKVSIEPNAKEGKAYVWGVTIEVKSKSDLESYYYPLYFYNTNTEIKYIEECLNALTLSDGIRYQDLERERPSSALAIGNLEDIMFTSINLLYSLYNSEFEKNTNEYKVFAPITKLLHTYGENFETVLSIAKEVATIL